MSLADLWAIGATSPPGRRQASCPAQRPRPAAGCGRRRSGAGAGPASWGRGAAEVIVYHYALNEMAADVLLDGGDVVRDAQTVGLARLSGDVADVELERGGGGEGAADAGDQQVRQDAGVEAARAQYDHVGGQEGAYRLRVSGRVLRQEEHLLDAALGLRVADAGFALDRARVVRLGAERNVGECGGDDLPAHGQHSAGLSDGFLKVADDP